MKIAIILGTRPEIIKMSPIIKECLKKKLDFFILHTNQHYSHDLDNIFFEELQLPRPKYNLKVGSGTQAEQTGKMMIGIEKVLTEERTEVILVEGDTNTVLAGALTAVKLHIKVAHVEAGLRSYFNEMPEEINRLVADHCSDFLFAPTGEAKNNLVKEGILKNKIFVVGNTIVDAIYNNLKLAESKSDILLKLNLKKKNYFLLTLHRQENVDNKERLCKIFQGIDLIHKKSDLIIVFPIHPRTKKRISEFGIEIPTGIKLIEPTGYLDFLQLEKNTALVLTDSGGVQEETCILGVPCVTLRDNTERSETLKVGSNILAGVEPKIILKSFSKMIYRKKNWKNPFGDGTSAKKIIKIILNGF